MEDEPYLDYHEVFPTRWEMTASYAICCAKCNETKHPRLFRRQLTRAQAEARGYKGMRNQEDQPRHLRGLRTVTVESKFCIKCQPGHYKPSEMTIPEMYRAAYDGKASLARVAADADNKREKARHAKSLAVRKRWDKWKAAPWTHVRKQLAEELLVVTRRIIYYNQRNPDKAMLAALLALQEAMTVLRARCTLSARTQAPLDPTTTWEDLLGAPVMRQLHELWDAVSAALKGRMKTVVPLVLNKARPLVLEGYTPPNQDGVDRLQTIKDHAYTDISQAPRIRLAPAPAAPSQETQALSQADQDALARLQLVKDHMYGTAPQAPSISLSKFKPGEVPAPRIRLKE